MLPRSPQVGRAGAGLRVSALIAVIVVLATATACGPTKRSSSLFAALEVATQAGPGTKLLYSGTNGSSELLSAPSEVARLVSDGFLLDRAVLNGVTYVRCGVYRLPTPPAEAFLQRAGNLLEPTYRITLAINDNCSINEAFGSRLPADSL